MDQVQNNLDDFDPIAELQKVSSEADEEGGLNMHQRRSIWKQNFAIKNELKYKVEKQDII